MFKKITFSVVFFLMGFYCYSQKDSIKLFNGETLIGKVKRLDKSILSFSTSYSDSDFKIKWNRVKEIYSNQTFILTLTDGRRFNSSVKTDSINKKRIIVIFEGEKIKTDLNKLTSLDPIKDSFYQRMDISFGAGFSLTQANNFSQVTGNAKVNYKGIQWNFLTGVNVVYSRQDNTDDISRFESNSSIQRFLQKDWFLQVNVDFLSNSDQKLDLRSTGSAGAGYFFIKNNNLYLGGGVGLAFNIEKYSVALNNKSSLESSFNAEFNKYNLGDFSLSSSATFLPSITEKGRVRFDCNLSLKYDITSKIYIKSAITYNFDNQPAIGAPDNDYTFQTTLGWKK